MIWWPPGLKKDAEKEAYSHFDANIRELPKKPDGTIDTMQPGYDNNDVDAFRHAYVSGIFTYEYGEKVAEQLGWLNEFFKLTPETESESNMDLWNNAVGRRFAMKHTLKKDFINALKKALDNGELIIDPKKDKRIYKGAMTPRPEGNHTVIVLKKSSDGVNEIFFDMKDDRMMTREEFVAEILIGKYPGYTIRTVKNIAYPVSKRDSIELNNLG